MHASLSLSLSLSPVCMSVSVSVSESLSVSFSLSPCLSLSLSLSLSLCLSLYLSLSLSLSLFSLSLCLNYTQVEQREFGSGTRSFSLGHFDGWRRRPKASTVGGGGGGNIPEERVVFNVEKDGGERDMVSGSDLIQVLICVCARATSGYNKEREMKERYSQRDSGATAPGRGQ
jgi:hypothetical protein